MGPQTTELARRKTQITLPPDLAHVALVDARTAAAVGGMSVSWWSDLVAVGKAPQPAIRSPRFTRWRMSDVRAFWAELADGSKHDAKVIERATKASRVALQARAKSAGA
jgi:predicted DNA-binding transcriptional regulator AlpA